MKNMDKNTMSTVCSQKIFGPTNEEVIEQFRENII
jgi:hypothetical protein